MFLQPNLIRNSKYLLRGLEGLGRPEGSFFIYFRVNIDMDEILAEGTTFDFVDCVDNSSGNNMGFYLDIPNNWVFYDQSQSQIVTIPVTGTLAATWHTVDLRFGRNGNGTFSGDFIVDGISSSFFEFKTITIDEIDCGARYAGTGELNAHQIDSLIVGTTLGGNDLFDGTIGGSIIPPFDSVVGSTVSAVAGTIRVDSVTDAYAVKSITPQVLA